MTISWTLAFIIGIIAASLCAYILEIFGMRWLLQPIGMGMIILGIVDWFALLMRDIKKAGGWRKWKLKLKKEIEERKELPPV